MLPLSKIKLNNLTYTWISNEDEHFMYSFIILSIPAHLPFFKFLIQVII